MKLSDLIKTEEIKIPNTDLKITIKTELSWFDQMEIAKDGMKTEEDLGKILSVRLIKDWNLEDDENKKLPITKEIVERLPAYVMLPVIKRITEIADKRQEKKKN